MLCPYCGFDESNVIESRDAQDGKATRRRRECVKCQKRFTTYEKVGNIELKVLKKTGKVEDYNREKLEKCMDKACWKMTAPEKSKFIDDVEMRLLNWPTVEIPSRDIGLLVMEKLKDLDPVSYVRFATVYLDIETINDFEKLVNDYKKIQK